MTFPMSARLYTKSDLLLSTEVSAVYAFNTAGAILGSLIAGFLLIPHIGSQTTLVMASCISIGTGIVLARLRPQFLFAGAAMITYVIFLPKWDPELMASAMGLAIEAGRKAYLAGRMPKRLYASASSPLAGVVR